MLNDVRDLGPKLIDAMEGYDAISRIITLLSLIGVEIGAHSKNEDSLLETLSLTNSKIHEIACDTFTKVQRMKSARQ